MWDCFMKNSYTFIFWFYRKDDFIFFGVIYEYSFIMMVFSLVLVKVN